MHKYILKEIQVYGIRSPSISWHKQTMTKKKTFNLEPSFSDWCRNNPELDAQDKSLYVTDIDYSLFRYVAGELYFLEVKTRGASPNPHQKEVLEIIDQVCQYASGNQFSTRRGKRPLTLSGVYCLTLQNRTPEDSEWMLFGRATGPMYTISKFDLERVMGGTASPISPGQWVSNQSRRVNP